MHLPIPEIEGQLKFWEGAKRKYQVAQVNLLEPESKLKLKILPAVR
ncbi:18461_t:CDS:1, partial [Racocetra persica]